MGLKSFLRRWLGIESVEKTVKKTVGRAYQQPVLVKRISPVIPYEQNNNYKRRTKSVAEFYNKCGGFHNLSIIEETYGDYSSWCRISTSGVEWRFRVKDYRVKSNGRCMGYSKSFLSRDRAQSFHRAFIAHHERMKAKAAKSGLNYN
jgi:hypothetical protein